MKNGGARASRTPCSASVCVYRGRCARERSAAFTPLPHGTVPVTLRIFPSAWNRRTVKRPEGRAPAALGRGAKHVPASRRTLGAPAHFREIMPKSSRAIGRRDADRCDRDGRAPLLERNSHVSVVGPNLVPVGIPERLPATCPDFSRHSHGFCIIDATIAGFLKQFPGDRVA